MSDTLACTARGVQLDLEQFYALEPGPDVSAFVKATSEGERESLVFREEGDELGVALFIPAAAAEQPRTLGDAYIQLVEGVSHFVHLTERARTDLPTTALELELQAEVDKFVLFAFDGDELVQSRVKELQRSLYERVWFTHAADTEPGQRYRLANQLAARLSARLLRRSGTAKPRILLQRFYRAGQAEKIRFASAA